MKILLPVFILLLLLSCSEHGIAPKPKLPESTGFSGKITFLGVWPDSIQRTHLVVFKDSLLDQYDFNILNLKYVSYEIPYGTRVVFYNTTTDSAYLPPDGIFQAGEYAYVAVAQSKTPELSLYRRDWFVAGVYYANADTSGPGRLIVNEGQLTKDIDIICDFDNPPPQPPGGNR